MNCTHARIYYVFIILISAVWLYLQRGAIAVLPGDEAIYLYGGKLISDGYQPYRDFFLAHPPLRVIFASLQAFLPITTLKFFLLLLVPIGGITCGLVVMQSRGVLWACLAVSMYMFATLNLEIGGVLLGPELALPFLACSMYSASIGRFVWSGIFLSIASFQALYALLPAPLLALMSWRQRGLSRFAIGCSMMFIGYFLFFVLWGKPFLDQVFLYHLSKVSGRERPLMLGRVAKFVYTESGLIAFPLATFLDRNKRGLWIAITGLFCLAVAAFYRALFVHYFAIALPFLATAAAFGLSALYERLRPVIGRYLAFGALSLVLVLTHLPHVLYGIELDADRAIRRRDAEAIADAIARIPPPSNAIWGDSALVPLIALRNGHDVALQMPDTNNQRFDSKISDPSEVIQALSKKMPGVLLIDDHGIALVPELRDFVVENMKEVFSATMPSTGWTCRYYLPLSNNARK